MFPAPAGLNRRRPWPRVLLTRVPRVCGDESLAGEWSEESSDLNRIMQGLRIRLESMYHEQVAREVSGVRKLVDEYFPEEKQKNANSEFLAALQKLYDGLLSGATKVNNRVFYDLAANIAVMAARQCKVSPDSLTRHLQSTVARYAEIEAGDCLQSSVRQLRELALGEIDPREALLERLAQWNATRVDKLSKVAAVHGANWYAREAYRKAGVKRLKWIANGSRSCNICRQLNGKIVGIEKAFVGKGEVIPGGAGKWDYTARRAKMHPPVHGGCVCAIIPLYEDYWVTDEKTDDLGHLVNAGQAVAVKEKFTKYCLDLESENQDAKIKAEMFAEILGIKKNDWRYLHELVLAGLQKYRPVRKKHARYGDIYTIMMPVSGLTGKRAVLETAWIYKNGVDFPQLVTSFVPRKNKERRYLFLLDDLLEE